MGSYTGAKGDGGGGNNCSCKTCKAPVKSSPTTNQNATFYRSDFLPVANQQRQSTERKTTTATTTFVYYYKDHLMLGWVPHRAPKEPLGIAEEVLYRTDGLPVTQPTVLKHRRKTIWRNTPKSHFIVSCSSQYRASWLFYGLPSDVSQFSTSYGLPMMTTTLGQWPFSRTTKVGQ